MLESLVKTTGYMKNDFDTTELTRWFMDNYECWTCGRNHWDCFHHIMGRNEGRGTAESSILNAAPLNNFECHLKIHGQLMTKENQKRLLQKTMRHLLKQGYTFNKNDETFIEKYIELYELGDNQVA